MNPQIACASLDVHQLLRNAVGDVVDESLRPLTQVDAGLPISRNRKTNPPQTSGLGTASQRPPTPGQSASAAPDSSCPPPPIAHRNLQNKPNPVDLGLRPLTPVDAGLHPTPLEKTNPPGRDLTPRHLAAARLIALGRRPSDVATELGVTRQALWKWTKHPAFAAEVRRLHERLTFAGRRP